MPGIDDQPLDPQATDQLAAALGPPPVDADLAGAPQAGGAPWSWIPPSWSAPPADGAPPPSAAPAMPPTAPPVGIESPAPPPPVDNELAGPPPLVQLPPAPAQAEPAALPGADAISGVGGTLPAGATPTPSQRRAAIAQRYSQQPEALIDRLINGTVDADTQQYLDEMAQRDPASFAELGVHLADAKAKHLAAEQARIANEDFERQKANLDMRSKAVADAQAKSAQLDAEATRLANTEIGPHLSTFQKVAGVLMGLVGGLYQGRTGSARNPGLDAFNDIINRDLESQRAQLANQRDLLGVRRNALAEQYARSGDMYQAAETMRLAALKHADDLLATQQQNFAPDGTRGLQIAQLRAGIAAQQSQAFQAFGQKQFENSLKLQDAARQQQIANETVRHNRASEGVEYAKLSLERAKSAGENAVLTPDQIRQQFPSLPAAAVPSASVTIKQLGQHVETYNKSLETAQKTTANAQQQAGTQVVGPDGRPLTQDGTAGGKPIVMPSTEQAGKLNESIAGAQDLLGSLGSVRRFLASDPSAVDRKAWAAAKTDVENAKFAFAKLHDTKASSKELEAMSDLFGPNPDSYSSRVKDKGVMLAHIDTVIKDAESTVANRLRRVQYTGPSVLVDTSQLPVARNTPEEEHEVNLLRKPTGGFEREFADALAQSRLGMSPDELRAFGPPITEDEIRDAGYGLGAGRDVAAARRGLTGGPSIGLQLTPQQRAVFDEVARNYDPEISAAQRADVARLAAVAGGDSKESQVARARLQQYADKASSTALRSLANRALEGAVTASVLRGEPEAVR